MEQPQQTQQTEKIIVEMLDFLESSSSEEDNDLEQSTLAEDQEVSEVLNQDVNDKHVTEISPTNSISKNLSKKKNQKLNATISKELEKLKQQYPIWNTREIVNSNKEFSNSHADETSELFDKSNLGITLDSDYVNNDDWQTKLESNCRRSSSNTYIQEVHKALYQDTSGHPANGSADYYQAAQNYALYGKNFFDFPENVQAVLSNKTSPAVGTDGSNVTTNFGPSLYGKPNTSLPNSISALPTVPPTSAAASVAAYYQIWNTMQTQTRPQLSTNPTNSTAYCIFLGNKVTYVAASPASPSMVYNQHSTTTTNFISNSLANAALATSPAILYTNPLLTTTTQQYLNAFFKETQYLSTALTANAAPTTGTVGGSNASGAGIYERLLYAQMLQQQLYQTQQAAAVAAMFQHKQRAAVAAATIAAAARQTNANKGSSQHMSPVPTSSSSVGSNFNTCTRQARSNSPVDLLRPKQQSTLAISATGNTESSKSSGD